MHFENTLLLYAPTQWLKRSIYYCTIMMLISRTVTTLFTNELKKKMLITHYMPQWRQQGFWRPGANAPP
jgi:hypothetical protein